MSGSVDGIDILSLMMEWIMRARMFMEAQDKKTKEKAKKRMDEIDKRIEEIVGEPLELEGR